MRLGRKQKRFLGIDDSTRVCRLVVQKLAWRVFVVEGGGCKVNARREAHTGGLNEKDSLWD